MPTITRTTSKPGGAEQAEVPPPELRASKSKPCPGGGWLFGVRSKRDRERTHKFGVRDTRVRREGRTQSREERDWDGGSRFALLSA